MVDYEAKWAEAFERNKSPRERGWTTAREEREKMRYDTPSGRTIYITDEGFTTQEPEPVKDIVQETPSQKHRKALSEARKQAYEAKEAENEQKRALSEEKRKQKELEAAAREGRRQGMGPISKIKDTAKHAKSELKKIKPQKVEIVDEELEAARKKGYDARVAEKRARQLVEAEEKGRRQAMTFKSKVREDVKPVAKRVAKNAKGLAREALNTPGQIAQTIGQTAIEIEKQKTMRKAIAAKHKTTTTAKPQAQRKEKPGPAARKATLGRREGGLPVKSHKSGPGRRAGGLPVKSHKSGPGRRTGGLPTNNIPKTATVNKQRSVHVNKQRSVNFAMRKRSKK
jgi:membrane protein involved in colicin uptake